MIEPIRPEDVTEQKLKSIPPEVIGIFNELIAANWNGSRAVILTKEAVERIRKKFPTVRPYAAGYLEVEDIYRRAGWEVEYDSPGFNETYDSSYTFSRKDA